MNQERENIHLLCERLVPIVAAALKVPLGISIHPDNFLLDREAKCAKWFAYVFFTGVFTSEEQGASLPLKLCSWLTVEDALAAPVLHLTFSSGPGFASVVLGARPRSRTLLDVLADKAVADIEKRVEGECAAVLCRSRTRPAPITARARTRPDTAIVARARPRYASVPIPDHYQPPPTFELSETGRQIWKAVIAKQQREDAERAAYEAQQRASAKSANRRFGMG